MYIFTFECACQITAIKIKYLQGRFILYVENFRF